MRLRAVRGCCSAVVYVARSGSCHARTKKTPCNDGSLSDAAAAQEFCDLGTLAEAARRGAFQPKPNGRWTFDHTYVSALLSWLLASAVDPAIVMHPCVA